MSKEWSILGENADRILKRLPTKQAKEIRREEEIRIRREQENTDDFCDRMGGMITSVLYEWIDRGKDPEEKLTITFYLRDTLDLIKNFVFTDD